MSVDLARLATNPTRVVLVVTPVRPESTRRMACPVSLVRRVVLLPMQRQENVHCVSVALKQTVLARYVKRARQVSSLIMTELVNNVRPASTQPPPRHAIVMRARPDTKLPRIVHVV